MSRSPAPEKYASAFSPPLVNCLTFRRRFSEGSSTGEDLLTGLCPADNTAADKPKNSARGNSIFVLITLKGEKRPRRETVDSTTRPYFKPPPPPWPNTPHQNHWPFRPRRG